MPPAMLMPRPPVCRTMVRVSWQQKSRRAGRCRKVLPRAGPPLGAGPGPRRSAPSPGPRDGGRGRLETLAEPGGAPRAPAPTRL